MKLVIRYNAARFPRAVKIRGGNNTSFLENRKILELEEYDALYLLKSNSRLTPIRWEFSVVGVVQQNKICEGDKIINMPEEKNPQSTKEEKLIKNEEKSSASSVATKKSVKKIGG